MAIGWGAACGKAPAPEARATSTTERSARTPAELGVVVVVVDALRADALRCYGGDRVETVHLDALAARGLRFTSAFSNSTWTLPSTVSLFTSTLPPVHRISRPPGRGDQGERLALVPDEYVMVPEVLREHGFRTAIVTMSGWISSEGGYDQGVEELIRVTSDDAIVEKAEELLRRFADERFFIYLHFKELHNYYEVDRLFSAEADLNGVSQPVMELRQFETAPTSVIRGLNKLAEEGRITPRDVAFLRASYDRELASTDAVIGRLASAIDRLGLGERTLLVVTSDHGERFLEHGVLTHAGPDFHNEVLHIPLIIAGPEAVVKPGVVERPVSTLDIMPTLLHLLGIPVPRQFQGSNVIDEGAPETPVIATDGREWKLITREWSYMVAKSRKEELYDRLSDATEQEDLAVERPDITQMLRRQLSQERKRMLDHEYRALRPPDAVEMSDDTRDRLRALGYLE